MTNVAQENDLVLLLSSDEKRFIIRLAPGETLHTHRGTVSHDGIIGRSLGVTVFSHLGKPFVVLEPSTHDLVMDVKRATQIIYPKEIGYLLLKMDIRPGRRVVEAGTGSGALTLALASAVMPDGMVYSYEQRDDLLRLAAKNLDRVGLSAFVQLRQRDIALGFDEDDTDALFLDVRTPWGYLSQAWQALKGGGFFGALVPTTNQVSTLLAALPHYGFADIEVCEILLRQYKPVAARLRPMDRMTAHTGYLIFGRKVLPAEAPTPPMEVHMVASGPQG